MSSLVNFPAGALGACTFVLASIPALCNWSSISPVPLMALSEIPQFC
jgi:hypothetical protein